MHGNPRKNEFKFDVFLHVLENENKVTFNIGIINVRPKRME